MEMGISLGSVEKILYEKLGTIKEKRRGKLSRKMLLLHDNALVHTAAISLTVIKECGFQLLPHPPYSPDLAPSDFFLFQQLKKHLRGSHYDDDDDVKDAVQAWFAGCENTFFSEGIRRLTNRSALQSRETTSKNE